MIPCSWKVLFVCSSQTKSFSRANAIDSFENPPSQAIANVRAVQLAGAEQTETKDVLMGITWHELPLCLDSFRGFLCKTFKCLAVETSSKSATIDFLKKKHLSLWVGKTHILTRSMKMPQGIIWWLVKEFSSFDASPAVPLLRLTCKVIQQTLYKETALRFVSFLLTLGPSQRLRGWENCQHVFREMSISKPVTDFVDPRNDALTDVPLLCTLAARYWCWDTLPHTSFSL